MVFVPSSDPTPDAFRLDGKLAWVTGASRGLGRHIALGLAEAGAEVIVSARDQAALEAVVAEIAEAGGTALALTLSVDAPDEVRSVVERIGQDHGAPHVLVNGAGVSPSFSPVLAVEDDVWGRVIDVNLSGTFYCSREAGRLMTQAGRGSVINISSVHGTSGMGRLAAYSASKAGVEALTRTLAMEWADAGVRVNVLAPGYFETDMTLGLRSNDRWRDRLLDRIPLGRFGSPSELVPATVFLASDAAAYVTGSTLRVDGGWTAA